MGGKPGAGGEKRPGPGVPTSAAPALRAAAAAAAAPHGRRAGLGSAPAEAGTEGRGTGPRGAPRSCPRVCAPRAGRGGGTGPGQRPPRREPRSAPSSAGGYGRDLWGAATAPQPGTTTAPAPHRPLPAGTAAVPPLPAHRGFVFSQNDPKFKMNE